MVTENNKIIAEFMGKEWNKSFFAGVSIINPSNITYKFDTDWNWLMEVVEKIESLDINKFSKQLGREDVKPIEGKFYLTVFDNQAEFLASVYYWQHDNNIKGLKKENGNSKIEAVYNACVEFIKWYNENKQSIS